MMKLPTLPLISSPMSRPMSRDKADMLLLLIASVLVLAPHVSHLPAWISATCSVMLLWRGWITFRGNRLPPRWLLVPIAVITMAGVYWTYRTFFGRDAGVSMLVLLFTFKLLEIRAKRDLFVAIFLSFFLILATFFYSQTIGTAAMTIIAVIAILTTQLSYQYTDAVPPLIRRIKLTLLISGLAVPLTLVLFVLFPRIQGPLWGLPSDAGSSRTGLSDSMSPGNISSLAQSGDIAFRVKFIDPAPGNAQLYWRGVVLGNYDGRTWRQLQPTQRSISANVIEFRGRPIRHQVTLEPNGQRWLFALEMPNAAPILLRDPATFSPDLQLLARRPVTDRIRYDVTSFTDFDLQVRESQGVLDDWLQLPRGFNPATLEFAHHLRASSTDDSEVVQAVLKYFRVNNFRYTLEPPLLGRHAVDDFLFNTRAGFCEHYASAFVVLMRAMHIPSRVVTGYQGGEINSVDGFMSVRQSDAHAWAEVWIKNRGWKRVDPTAAVAPSRVEHNLNSVIPPRIFGGLISVDMGKNSWLSKARLNWDAVTNSWNQWVLNYTPDKQKSFLQSLGLDNPDWQTMIILMVAFGTLATAIIVYPLLRSRQKVDPVNAAYALLCKAMAQRGLPRSIHEGPHAYAQRLAAPTSPLTDAEKNAAARFMQLYETVQYGKFDQAPATAVSHLKSLLAECR